MAVTLTTEMINSAIKTQQKYNVPASVTLGQIILESGGSYPGGLSGLAYNDNNLFGIKAGSNWNGKTATYNTQEYVNGKYVNTKATFRKYDSVSESIEDHAKLLSSNTYTSKTAGATNLTEYVKAIGGVYATSPTYADNLLSVINEYDLTQYDNGTLPTQNVTYSSNAGTTTSNSSSGSWLDSLLTNIVKLSMIIIIIVLGIVFLMKAFDVNLKKTASNVATKVIKKKTGVDVSEVVNADE